MPEKDSHAGSQRARAGAALAVFAGALLLLSIFLPKLECETLQLSQNRLVDGWEGVALIVCAALLILGAGLGLRSSKWGLLCCAAGLGAEGVAIYAGSGSRLIVDPGVPGLFDAVYAELGIGLVTAGLGALIAIGAGLLIIAGGRIRVGEAGGIRLARR